MADYIEDVKECLEKLELSTSALMLAVKALYDANVSADVTHPADYIGPDEAGAVIYHASSIEKVFKGSELTATSTKITAAVTAGTAAMTRIAKFRKKYKDNYAIDFKSSSPSNLADQFICIQDTEKT